jgi:hypothetical protein
MEEAPSTCYDTDDNGRRNAYCPAYRSTMDVPELNLETVDLEI